MLRQSARCQPSTERNISTKMPAAFKLSLTALSMASRQFLALSCHFDVTAIDPLIFASGRAGLERVPDLQQAIYPHPEGQGQNGSSINRQFSGCEANVQALLHELEKFSLVSRCLAEQKATEKPFSVPHLVQESLLNDLKSEGIGEQHNILMACVELLLQAYENKKSTTTILNVLPHILSVCKRVWQQRLPTARLLTKKRHTKPANRLDDRPLSSADTLTIAFLHCSADRLITAFSGGGRSEAPRDRQLLVRAAQYAESVQTSAAQEFTILLRRVMKSQKTLCLEISGLAKITQLAAVLPPQQLGRVFSMGFAVKSQCRSNSGSHGCIADCCLFDSGLSLDHLLDSTTTSAIQRSLTVSTLEVYVLICTIFFTKSSSAAAKSKRRQLLHKNVHSLNAALASLFSLVEHLAKYSTVRNSNTCAMPAAGLSSSQLGRKWTFEDGVQFSHQLVLFKRDLALSKTANINVGSLLGVFFQASVTVSFLLELQTDLAIAAERFRCIVAPMSQAHKNVVDHIIHLSRQLVCLPKMVFEEAALD